MKLSHISVIFIIIVIPIILLLSYNISLKIDTINMQTAYTTKQLEATKDAIDAFEINTVEWNEGYSETADSKRRDIMASINTFTTSFANSLGIGGTSKESILPYVPAIACTLYDGYYIYSPAETKEIIRDKNGVAVFMNEDIAEEVSYSSYNEEKDKGKLLYEAKNNAQGTYTTNDGISKSFTLDPDDAKSTYEHILKPFATYSARYNNGKTGVNEIVITVNYTLDNYITIYGVVGDKGYVVKSGYLIDTDSIPNVETEILTERIAWRYNEDLSYTCDEYNYVYAEDNTKVYFDINTNTAFQVSSTGIRTDLDETTGVKYKIIRKDTGGIIYQALNNGSFRNAEGESVEIKQGYWYTDKQASGEEDQISTLKKDYSAKNYYIESKLFTDWIQENLKDITIGDIQLIYDKDTSEDEKQKIKNNYGNLGDKIFDLDVNDPEDENSIFARHKREVIKQSLISNLNQSITSYSRNSEGEYQLPVLTEDDWDHILRNVSIITFVQGMPIGLKYYNNYTVATSTSNKEYVNIDGIYLSDITVGNTDDYYHMPYCEKLASNQVIGYRNIDYVIKSYQNENQTYYYKHQNIAKQECYYCLVQRDLFNEIDNESHEIAYKTALARERYNTIQFKH